MKKKLIVLILLAVTALTLAACTDTDIVATTAIKSFTSLLDAAPDKVASTQSGFSITSPAGTERFLFGDTIAVEFALAPFTAAGLDPAKLPEAFVSGDSALTLSVPNSGYAKAANAEALFEKLVRNNRDAVGYHSALDHYGVKLGVYGAFEWAKDLSTNDKDIVFVLDPAPFIAAGTDVTQVKGWLFAKVDMMENGKTVQVDKLLKPYNIK